MLYSCFQVSGYQLMWYLIFTCNCKMLVICVVCCIVNGRSSKMVRIYSSAPNAHKGERVGAKLLIQIFLLTLHAPTVHRISQALKHLVTFVWLSTKEVINPAYAQIISLFHKWVHALMNIDLCQIHLEGIWCLWFILWIYQIKIWMYVLKMVWESVCVCGQYTVKFLT